MKLIYSWLTAVAMSAAAVMPARAEIVLAPLFSDNMVIQRETEAALWGTATPGAKICVVASWNKGFKAETVAAADGKWQVRLSTPAAGGPHTISIAEGKNDRVTLRNVMSGEVWLCCGQSNMDMPLHGWGTIFNHEREIAEAVYPDLRIMQVKWNKSLL